MKWFYKLLCFLGIHTMVWEMEEAHPSEAQIKIANKFFKHTYRHGCCLRCGYEKKPKV